MKEDLNRENYTIENFVLDDDFCQWVLQPDSDLEAFWMDWLTKHPDQQEAVAEARELVLKLAALEWHPPNLSRREMEAAYQHFLTELTKKIQPPDDETA